MVCAVVKNVEMLGMIGPLIVSISGKTVLEKERVLLASPKVGGLVLFRENYDKTAENPKEALKLLIQEIRSVNPSIMIMVDHEGGNVWRFKKGFTVLPGAKAYGTKYHTNKTAALEATFQDGYTMAKELLAIGIDLSSSSRLRWT